MGLLQGIRSAIFGPSYDLNSLEGIKAIPIPTKKEVYRGQDVKKDLSYILQRKATEHKRNGRMDLAIACLRKSNQLMPWSSIMYLNTDYYRLVEYLKKDRQFDEARKAEAELNRMFGGERVRIEDKVKLNSTPFNLAKEMGSDLVEMASHGVTCSECAKYQGRVYSISGKNPRFPKLPDVWYKYGGLHEGCRHSLYTFFEGVSALPVGQNRPFIDNRTPEQKSLWEQKIRNAVDSTRDKEDYDWIYENLADIAPKSFGGYRKMKSSNSPNYKKLVEAAKKKNYIIK